MIRRVLEAGLIGAVIIASVLFQEKAGEKQTLQPSSFTYEEFRIIPVRVHLLHSDESVAVNTSLKKSDIDRIFRKANLIWHSAGLHLWVESIVDETPPSVNEVKMYDAVPIDVVLPLRPQSTHPEGMFHVYYVGAMTVNGIFKQIDGVFVQQASMLIAVPDGIDEPLPRVTSHELGHGLGLQHRQARTNLMASGTTGTLLNDEEIHTARRKAESFSWTYSPDEFMKATEELAKKGRREDAKTRFAALTQLPGESPLKTQAAEELRRMSQNTVN